MKTSKRILGVALALIMIFNVFAVCTSAAGTESAVDLYLATDKEVYAPGEDVVITVSAQAIEAVGDLRVGGGYAIGYNSAAIKPYSTDVENIDSHGVVALQGGYDAASSCIAAPQMSSLDTEFAAAYNWDSFIIYAIADDWETSYDATAKTDVFTFKMKIADDAADGTYTLGFNKDSYVNYDAYINDLAMGGIYGHYDDYGYGTDVNYGFGTCTFTVGTAAAEPTVTHVKTMGQMKDWATLTGPFNGGLVGRISNLPLTFDAGNDECTNLLKIEVAITTTAGTTTAEAYQVYDNGDGTYDFRAVIRGMDTTDEAVMSCQYTIYVDTDADGVSDKEYSSEAFDVTAAGIYSTALANYNASK